MKRSRIAIVEDNPDNAFLVESLLEDEFDTRTFGDGPSALEGLPDYAPDLVLMDISLPRMDGTEVFASLKARDDFADTPIVALTAHAMRGDRERLLELGFDGYVSKPIVDDGAFLVLVRELSSRVS